MEERIARKQSTKMEFLIASNFQIKKDWQKRNYCEFWNNLNSVKMFLIKRWSKYFLCLYEHEPTIKGFKDFCRRAAKIVLIWHHRHHHQPISSTAGHSPPNEPYHFVCGRPGCGWSILLAELWPVVLSELAGHRSTLSEGF